MRNLRTGLTLGLFVATGLSLWALLVRALVGTEPFERTAFSVGATIVHYYAGFLIGGALVGVFMPLRRWAVGSMFLGIIGVLPVYVAFAVSYARTVGGVGSWQVPGTLIVSVVVGGSLGLWIWSDERRDR